MKKFTIAAAMLGSLSAPAHADEQPRAPVLSQIFGGDPAMQQQIAYRSHRGRHAHYRAEHAAYGQSQEAAAAAQGGRSFVTRASYYGGGPRKYEPNSHTANGERFDQWGLTAAHRTLPMGTRLLVSHQGHSVVVRVNDRGPAAWTGRNLDLSRGAAAQLGLIGPGIGDVQVTVLASR